jgi:site-specific recombinase XerD
MDNTKNTATILKEFVESANRSRKYPDNTAMALKTALRLFETELREEELYSIEKFKENLDHIYQSVFEKNKTKYSSGSLDVASRQENIC